MWRTLEPKHLRSCRLKFAEGKINDDLNHKLLQTKEILFQYLMMLKPKRALEWSLGMENLLALYVTWHDFLCQTS